LCTSGSRCGGRALLRLQQVARGTARLRQRRHLTEHAMSDSQRALISRGLLSGVVLLIVMTVLLFGGAGTLAWWQGWLFLLIYFAWSIGVSVWLFHRDKALFERRMRGGPTAEKHAAQRIIMSIASIGFLGLIIVPALDHRFG